MSDFELRAVVGGMTRRMRFAGQQVSMGEIPPRCYAPCFPSGDNNAGCSCSPVRHAHGFGDGCAFATGLASDYGEAYGYELCERGTGVRVLASASAVHAD